MVLDLHDDQVPTWWVDLSNGKLDADESYRSFCEFVRTLNVTNDPAERI